MGLSLTLEEDEGVPCLSSVVHIDDDIAVCHSEVIEEVSDVSNLDRVRQSSHLEGFVLVFVGNEVREVDGVTVATLSLSLTTVTVSSVATSASSSTAEAASGSSSVSTTTTAAIVASASVVKLVLLILFEIGVFMSCNDNELHPSVANVFLVELLVSVVAVIGSLEQDSCLTSQLTVRHLSNLDRVLLEVESGKEGNNVFLGDGEWKSLELHGLHGGLVWQCTEGLLLDRCVVLHPNQISINCY